ncbi:sugar ABC transporter substrate-binding protein [uncultured Holdemanella sp.]|uniref:sugar ABC transporter substrate-binding protein n=1 Tax=uncultured Holdemanella sp. TaxID=1763549 RepID=UPI0025D93EEC|nr:sugar ABC transporter substrate-binding protein [uncultured Holdemanella sp.]
MEKPKSFAYIIFCLTICLAFAVGSNYFINTITQSNMIYNSREPRKIGATYMTYNNTFYSVVNDEISKVVKEHGDQLITLDSAMSLKKQKEQIQYLMDQQVEALVITPVDYEGLKEDLKLVYKKHIPVIIVDTEVKHNKNVTYSIVSDNYDAGVQCAKDMMNKLNHANIVLLQHSTTRSGYLRIKGFEDTIQSNPNYKVIKRMECEGQLEVAMPKMESFIQEGKDFDVVMCLNDPSAMGAMAALSANNMLDGKFVYGIDGTPEAKEMVAEGKMAATVAQSPKTFGKKAGEAIYKLFSQERIKNKNEMSPVQIITKENVQDYSTEGWQ